MPTTQRPPLGCALQVSFVDSASYSCSLNKDIPKQSSSLSPLFLFSSPSGMSHLLSACYGPSIVLTIFPVLVSWGYCNKLP